MDSRVLDRSEWKAASELLSEAIAGKQAEIEVASLRLGDQIEADWAPVRGFSYSPEHNEFRVSLEGAECIVREPRSFMVRGTPAAVDSLAIVGGYGDEHIVKFRDPLALPSPDSMAH